MLLSENKNYFITTFWPFMILIPFLGAGRRVTVYLSIVSQTALEAIKELKKQGYSVFSVEQVEHSTKLHTFEPQKGQKYAVMMGNEVKGVHQEVVDASDGSLEIPQLGTKHSMNVSVTTGIVIYKFAESLIIP